MTDGRAFLGVETSLTNTRWEAAPMIREGAELDRIAGAIADRHPDMPLPVTRLLAGRDTNGLDLDIYLEPKIRDLLPDPSRFRDMDRVVARLADAVEAGTRLAQLCPPNITYPMRVVVLSSKDELSETARGEGGFGSTGV